MAAPTLVGQGTIAASTAGTGNNPTIPTHQADDIIVVCCVHWGPNAVVNIGADNIGNAGGGSGPWLSQAPRLGTAIDLGGRGWLSAWWIRATSGSETGPSYSQSTVNWDSGADTVTAARVYVIRGCHVSGNPYDDVQTSARFTTANQNMPAVTVNGSERLILQFMTMSDNLSAGAAGSGYTAGTAATDATGQDSGFQTFRIDNTASSKAATASNVAAPAAGGYGFVGVSFKPPAPFSSIAVPRLNRIKHLVVR